MIGGIYTNDNTNDRSGTPFLQDIPVLGHLFRQNSRTHDTRELLFLITPRVVRNVAIVRPKTIPPSPDGSFALGESTGTAKPAF